MNSYGKLPMTGAGALMIGGVLINQAWLLGIAAALVLCGALTARLGWRRGKTANSR